ncbi:MAG: hypothetical protein WEE89_07895 [Gemmatimonadota bacterium]
MPNGEDKNWVRLCATVDGFKHRYGSWPTEIRLPALCLCDLKEHLFTPADVSRIEAKIRLVVDEDRFRATDAHGNSSDYLSEDFPDLAHEDTAQAWFDVEPRHISQDFTATRVSGDSVLTHVRKLLESVRALEALYPGRSFTLDGHLVGSIGEVLAAELYGLKLLPASSSCHDGVCPTGREVQVKLTQRERVGLYEEPRFLVVLQIDSSGQLREIYNGPGPGAWNAAGPRQKNGQRSISLSRLKGLNKHVAEVDRIAQVTRPNWLLGE